MKCADAILCTDLHIRESVPECRTDDFFAAQTRKLDFLRDLQTEHGCPVICAGDVFDHWKPSPYLIGYAIDHLPKPFVCVPGQHDLPHHELQLKAQSGIYVLSKTRDVLWGDAVLYGDNRGSVPFSVYGFPYDMLSDALKTMARPSVASSKSGRPSHRASRGSDQSSAILRGRGKKSLSKVRKSVRGDQTEPPPEMPSSPTERLLRPRERTNPDHRHIAVCHSFVWHGTKPYPDAPPTTAKRVLDALPFYDLVVTGDHHCPFVVESGGRVLVNAGPLTRQTAKEADLRPRVYLWFADENTVEAAYLPIDKSVVSREHIDTREERSERMEAFVEKLGDSEVESVDFEHNLIEHMDAGKVSKPVRRLVLESIER